MTFWKCPECLSLNKASKLKCICGFELDANMLTLHKVDSDFSTQFERDLLASYQEAEYNAAKRKGCRVCGAPIKKASRLYCKKCSEMKIKELKDTTTYFNSSVVTTFAVNENLDRNNISPSTLSTPIEDNYDEDSAP